MSDENAAQGETPENEVPEVEVPEVDPVEALQAENAELKDRVLRTVAEMENLRKRTERDVSDTRSYAIAGFARDMLEIADNFRRAIDSVPDEVKNGNDPLITNLLAGIDAIERGLLKTFEKHGIRKIEPLGQIFDPHFHEVMFEAPMPGKPAGTIIQLLEPGYTLNDRLLRPARVGVAKAEPGEIGGPAHQVDESV